MVLILMGVSGSGKTTIGRKIAERTGWIFADADDYHPRSLKQKMAAGKALTDEDRAPWLKLLNRLLRKWDTENTSGILACSALKASYREALESGLPPDQIKLVFLDASHEMLAERLRTREHEFMNPALLESQLTTLEAPVNAFRIVNDRSPDEIADMILEYIDSGHKVH